MGERGNYVQKSPNVMRKSASVPCLRVKSTQEQQCLMSANLRLYVFYVLVTELVKIGSLGYVLTV